ncbi:F-actin-capping protein subunit alpha [Gigaspora rosea]|uniref:F-actin-capping protein subunit alpha n=1 Tax=Gigaspora rosea TaxID=44941 RepID=A0A397V8P7_9GLOM|nr:F-actin-capping protein subunit alpha [Gigaspora rosea]CAG8479209.1 15211_t:CDS:2 [Gigaspora rosea]
MEGLSVEERLKIANSFLLDSPPGEVNDVYSDIKVLLNNNNAAYQEGLLDALRQYNIEQYVTVTLPEQESMVILSKYGQIENDRFFDPKSHQAFTVDHISQDVTEVEPHTPDETTEPLRSAVETAISEYVADHYPKGASATYSTGETITIAIVDNKYNPSNLWNGRWRSTWVISPESGEIKGTIKVNVHYYEEGNVQLNSTKDIEITSSPVNSEDLAASAAAYSKSICKAENEFQTALNESYIELSENTFKGLRRALPLTRHKIDWDKISNYKIGQELANKS